MMRLRRLLADGISTPHVLTACVAHFPHQLHLKVLPDGSAVAWAGGFSGTQEVPCCRREPAGGNLVKYGQSYQ